MKPLKFKSIAALTKFIKPGTMQQPVTLLDGKTIITAGSLLILDEPHYCDHTDYIGSLSEIKKGNPDDWEGEIQDYNELPIGTILLMAL